MGDPWGEDSLVGAVSDRPPRGGYEWDRAMRLMGLRPLPSATVDDEVARVLRERREAVKQAERDAEVARRLEQIEQLGTGSMPNGTVVAFTKAHGDKRYSYAAIKANGQWYTTGTGSMSRSDEDFCVWLLSGKGFADWQVLRSGYSTTTE